MKWIRGTAAALAAGLLAASSFAQGNFPSHPIKLVVAYPPGASTDATARIIGAKLTEELGQPVIVENRSGASGNIGSDYVAKAAPDGYTLLLATDATHTSNEFLFRNFPYNSIKDFTPITMAAKNILVLVANPSFPPNNVKELIEYAKQHPGKVSFGSAGTGSPHHLAGELMNRMAGIDMVHVPYRGGGPAATDVLGGQIPIIFSSLVTVMPQIQAGKLKALAVTEKTRYPGLPNVPTVAETLPGFEIGSWLGFFGPANMPAPLVAKLNAAIVKALHMPDVVAKLNANGLMPVGNSPAEFAAQQKADYEQRGKLIKSIGIQPE